MCEMLTWDKFRRAVLSYKDKFGSADLYRGFSYQDFMHGQLLQQLRTNPDAVPPNEIQDQVIGGFLNRWGSCRLKNTEQLASGIRGSVIKLRHNLKALNEFRIETVDFEKKIDVNKEELQLSQVIDRCYENLNNIKGVGPTVTSKLLHSLQPALFVMWDNNILPHYHQNDQQVKNTGAGYCVFLQIMQQIAMDVRRGFQSAVLDAANQDPADYLSKRMGYNPPKTMAKYLDEYNWMICSAR